MKSSTKDIEQHNRLAADLLRRLVTGATDELQAAVILESVVLGFLLSVHPEPKRAVAFLDVLKERVIERHREHARSVGRLH